MATMSPKQCVSLLFILLTSGAESARILGVFTVASVSHQIVFQPIWKELSLRGHQVTVLTPNPLNDPSLTNLTEIDLSFQYKIMENLRHEMAHGMDHWTILRHMLAAFLHFIGFAYENDVVKQFVKAKNGSYDVVLAEAMDPTTYAFAAKFKCPLIGIASLNAMKPTHAALGTPLHPVFHGDFSTPYNGDKKLNLFEKIDAVLFDLYQNYVFHYKLYPWINELVKKQFGPNIPRIQDLEKNMSLLLLNTNPILHGSKPYGPNVIEFGGSGIHLKPKKPLPAELKSFLDNSPEGVVYFSLGSNVKSALLPENIRKVLIETFAQLPYKVLWKFEDDELKDKPNNVKISKWLPQQDLLGHPNVKLFITQAGLQSFEEAVLNGVPVLALPFIADQFVNAMRMEKLGVGLCLDYNTLSTEKLLNSILEITKSAKYKDQIVEIRRLLRDQPMTGLEKVVWWTEYVIRNKGAPYLRNTRADISWSEFLMLDVAAFLLGTLIATLFIFYKICRLVSSLIFRKRQEKRKLQ